MRGIIYKYVIFILIICTILINIDNIFLCARLDSIETFNNSININEDEIIFSLNHFDNGKNINIESIIKEENSTYYKISLIGREGIYEIHEILKKNKSLELYKLQAFCHKNGVMEGRVEIIEQ